MVHYVAGSKKLVLNGDRRELAVCRTLRKYGIKRVGQQIDEEDGLEKKFEILVWESCGVRN